MTENTSPVLRLHGSACVHIDWANVYGWTKSLKKAIDPTELFRYLGTYPQVKEINFYYGLDTNSQSQDFLKKIQKIGFILHTKPVKHIRVSKNPPVFKRKYNFDLKTTMNVLLNIQKFNTHIFFTGDGDFEPLYE